MNYEFAIWVQSDFLTETLYDIVKTIEQAHQIKQELEAQGIKVKIIPTPKILLQIEAE